MPVRVLISEMASAPAFSAARAVAVMSAVLGVSLTTSGCVQCALAALTTSYTLSGYTPKATPPSFTLGQEMFNSTISTGWLANFSVI